MRKKYQVFVSSTYEDLKDERAAAIQYLLDNDCIPVGMEQFPASDMSQMEYIEKMLEDCDYYILILAGRYGTGYTEKEYDYACKHGIPVLSFVIKDVGSLPVNKSESEPDKKEKLLAFRKKVCSSKLVKFYTNVDTLKAEIATSINKATKEIPAAGWVRGKKESPQKETQTKKNTSILPSYLPESSVINYTRLSTPEVIISDQELEAVRTSVLNADITPLISSDTLRDLVDYRIQDINAKIELESYLVTKKLLGTDKKD